MIWNGEILKKIRKTRGINQTELAAMIGTSQQLISRWEKNDVEPSKKYLERLSMALEVDAEELFGITKMPRLSFNEDVDRLAAKLLEKMLEKMLEKLKEVVS